MAGQAKHARIPPSGVESGGEGGQGALGTADIQIRYDKRHTHRLNWPGTAQRATKTILEARLHENVSYCSWQLLTISWKSHEVLIAKALLDPTRRESCETAHDSVGTGLIKLIG